MGYPYGKKGWKVFDLHTREYFVSRDVTFVEHEYPFIQLDKAVHDETPLCRSNETHVPLSADEDDILNP